MPQIRDVPGFPGYRVGDDGSMWSCRRHGKLTHTWKQMHGSLDRRGYVNIKLRQNGKSVRMFLHRLVLEAFVGPCPAGMEGCHKNSQPADCRLENLRWGTHKSNGKDMVANGTSQAGEKHHHAKLTWDQVDEIRRLVSQGGIKRRVAMMFAVSPATVTVITQGKTWKVPAA